MRSNPRLVDDRAISPAKPERSHVAALDGVRGLAILLVLVFHFTSWASDSVDIPVLFHWTTLGQRGVDLFFVLSGYLITGILWDTRRAAHFFKNFYMRRALRIFPLYYFAVLATVLLAAAFPGNPKYQAVAEQQAWLWTYTVNIAMALKSRWGFYGMNHFWSLSVEEQFYLVWPFVVWRLERKTLIRVCFVLAAVAIAIRAWFALGMHTEQAPYVLTVCRMDSLLLGAALALETRGPEPAPGGWSTWSRRLGLGSLGLVLLAQTVPAIGSLTGRAFDLVVMPTVFAVIFAGMISATLARRGWLRRTFEQPVLRFFGRYSYGLYVFHHPLKQLWQKLVPLPRAAMVLHSDILGTVVFTCVGVAGSTAIAWLSFRLMESRFLALKGRFEDRSALANGRAAG
jgi:peptidoglycan/LPS O-acetylase OafA/YrhL